MSTSYEYTRSNKTVPVKTEHKHFGQKQLLCGRE